MNAFPAAKRTIIVLMSLVFLVSGLALAAEGDGYLGVMLQDLSPSMAKALQLGEKSGVLVNEVVDGSPADDAGLLDGDIILVFDGTETPDPEALTKAVRKAEPGDQVDLVVLRDGKEKKIPVEVGEQKQKVWTYAFGDGEDAPRPDRKTWVGKDDGRFHVFSGGDHDLMFIDEDRGYLGIQMNDLSEQLGQYFGVQDGHGALITEVVKDSPAEAGGLKAGDVIIELAGKSIESTSQLHKEMAGTETDQKVDLKVMRQGKEKTFTVTLGRMPEDAAAKGINRFIIGGDDPHAGGPRMLRHFGEGDGDHDVIIKRMMDPEGHLEIKRLQPGSEDLDQVHKELEELRQELKEMRKELKKND